MRIGLVCDLDVRSTVDEIVAIETAGLDVAWVTATDRNGTARSASALAASVASSTGYVRVAVEMQASRHPIEIAEELAVTDLLLGGRLIGVLVDDDGERIDAIMPILVAALTSRPFDPTTGGRPSGAGEARRAVRVTPSPAQIEFPLWLLRPDGRVESRFGARPIIRDVVATANGTIDIAATVSMLLDERERSQVDVCVLRLPHADPTHRRNAIDDIAKRVRPQVQLDSLPSGLVTAWDAVDPVS